MTTQIEKAKIFKALHEQENGFVIPNPWDAGSARLLAHLGFKALATTSWGFAASQGLLDGGVTLEKVIEHCRELCAATDLPVSADFENGFADDPAQAAVNILRVAETGLAGCSIEDSRQDASKSIYDFNQAVEKVSAAVEAVRSLGFPFVLTARAENLLHGKNDLDDTIRRLQAFEAAGADVLYAPGLKTLHEVRLVISAVNKPVNVLAPMIKGVTAAQLYDAGVKRISVGGALYRATITPLLQAGIEMRDQGSFEWVKNITPGAEITAAFKNT
jgi:2-methylisocitrate lyase-like PEP mutase family enzyme